MEEVYIVDGEEISLAEIQDAATASDLSVEDYIGTVGAKLKNQEEKKEEVVVEDAAPAATENEAATELFSEPGSSDSETDSKPPFVPHPDGEAYYEKLPMMDKEKMAYTEWKETNKPKEDEPTPAYKGAPLIDVTEGITTKLDINFTKGDEANFEAEVKEDFNYVPEDPELYKVIIEAEKRKTKGEDKEYVGGFEVAAMDNETGELNKYYPGRFKSHSVNAGSAGLVTTIYDTQQKDIFGNDKSIDPETFLAPIRREKIKMEGAKLRSKLKVPENDFVELNIESLSNFDLYDQDGKDLKTFYEEGYLTPSAQKYIDNKIKRFDRGVYSTAEKEIYDLYKDTGKIDKENLLRLKANAGDRAYDENGNLIGVSVQEPITPIKEGDLNLTESEAELVNQRTLELQEKAPTAETLLDARNNAFFELLAIDKDIAENAKEVIDGNEGIFNSFLNWLSGDKLTDKAVSQASFAGYEGDYIGKNITKIMSKHPLAQEHNEKLMELLSLDRAIKLNSNLMTIDEGNFLQSAGSRFISSFQKGITGIDAYFGTVPGVDAQPYKVAEYYAGVMKDAGLQVDQEILEKDINNSSALELGSDVVGSITPLLMSIAIAKKPGVKINNKMYGVKPALNRINAYFRGAGMGRSQVVKKTLNVMNGISKEIVTIAAANEMGVGLWNGERLPLTDAVIFGAGNSIAAGMQKYAAMKYLPYFSEFSRTRMGIGFNASGRMVVGGATATAIGKSAQGINAAASYWSTGDEKAFHEAMKELGDIDALTGDLVGFTMLGMRGNVVRDVKSRILALDSRSSRTVAASKVLGVKEFSSPKEIAEALDVKMKELGVDKMNSAQMNSPEVKKQMEKFKLAATTLNTQLNIVEAKKAIEQQTDNYKTTDAKLDIIGKKIASNQELSVKDLKEIGKFSDTPISDGKGGYNFRSPVEAMNQVIAGKLGISKNSPEFNEIQGSLAEYSEMVIQANDLFKGESKQIQAKKDLFIGKYLDQRNAARKIAEIKAKTKDNPSLDLIYRDQLKDLNETINDLQNQRIELLKEGREVEKGEYQADIDFVASEAPELGVDFRELDAAKYIEIAEENGFSNESDAVYLPVVKIGGKTFKDVILVNRDRALSTGAVSAASHELSHFLTRKAFKGKDGLFTQEGRDIIDSFVNENLTNEQKAAVEKRINDRYDPNNPVFKEKYYEEYLNVFLDATKRGDVKMDADLRQKFNSFINRSFGKRIDLNTGGGVKNFLDLLSRSGKNGSLDVRIKDFAKETSKSEPLEAEFVKMSTSDRQLSDEVNDLLGIERDEFGDITMTREEFKTGDGGVNLRLALDLLDPKNRLLNTNLLNAGGLKIGKGDIVIEGKGFSKEQFIIDLKEKLKPVVENWDPQRISGEQGGLLGWINNPRNIDNKKKSVFDDYTKIALAEKAARGEYTGAEKGKEIVIAPEPFQAGRTNPIDILPSELRAEAIEEVRSKLPKTREELQAFLKGKNYKSLKNLADATTAKFFGVPENKISKPQDNLSGNEPQRAQMKLAQNKSKFIDIIPKNNIDIYKEFETLDGKRVIDPKTGKEKFKYVSLGDVGTGKATGLPRNIRKALYKSIGRPKGVNNEVFVLKDNLTEADIMKVFGIVDGKKAGDFQLRTPDAQSIKGAMELVSRGIGNKIVRDIATEMDFANEALNLAQGKNVYMASLSALNNREIPSFVEEVFKVEHVGPIAERFSKLPYGTMVDDKAIKKIITEEFKEGRGVYKTIVDPITKEEYTFTAKDIDNLSKALLKARNISREVPSMQKKLEVDNEINRRDIKDFIQEVLMQEGSMRATEKFFGDLLPKDSRGKTISLENQSNDIKNITKRRQLAKEMWREQAKEADNVVDWINDNFGLSEQFNSASKIGAGRFQYYKGIKDFTPEFNEAIKDTGYKVVNQGQKYFIENSKGERVKEINRFGKTQSNSNWAIKKINKAFKNREWDINDPAVKEMDAMFEDVAVRSRKILENQMLYMINKYKAGDISAVDMALYTMELKSGMGTVLRMAAPWKKIYQPNPGEKLITEQSRIKTDAEGKPVLNAKGKPVREKLLIWEHSKPAEQMVFELLDVYLKDANLREVQVEDGIIRYELNKQGKQALAEAFEGYEVAIIPKAMDNVITALGRAEGVEKGKNRYYDDLSYGRPEMRATVDITTGKIEGEAWAIAAEQASNVKLAETNKLQGEPAFTSKSKERNNFDYLKDASAQDKALTLAKDPNKPVKKIRVFDFDDTLAKSKSSVFYNKPNTSGKPTPKRKAIFMIGGPGSGKSNVGKGLELGREGWKVVNQDIFIESEKAKAGLPESEKGYTKEQKSARAKIGAAGRKAAEAKMEKYRQAGEGMVIDGTGASYNATMKKVNALKNQGYDVFMVHAKTSNEVALERNRARKERSLPDFIVEKTQESVNNNIEKYKKDLGGNFLELDTETIEYGKPLPKDFISEVKSKVYKNERGVLNAEEFAKDGKGLIEEGAVMDFTDFNIVREGERGPLFEIAEKIRDARGTDDVFVLTARAPESQQAIHEFLKSEGLDIPLKNITGLGNSTGEAKAQWLVSKAAEGYNDFYFADDAVQNVKAVKDALSVLDVKSKVQRAMLSKSEDRGIQFNKLIENSTGVEYYKEFSAAKAKTIGATKDKFKFFIPYGAEDFLGLIYPTLGKGKTGDAQMAWYKENLLNPYARANDNLSKDRVQLMADFKELKKKLDVPADLRKSNKSGFTNEAAVRVYLFEKTGNDMTKFGLSKTDSAELLDIVNGDAKLKAFADQLLTVTKGDGYATPTENWLVGTITTDLIDLINTTKRTKYLEEWQRNVDEIYTKENLNKLESIYGTKYRGALENMLGRMKSGRNRLQKSDGLSNRVLDYINGSNGAIMFFNTRSAILQTISSINFLNWGFNNPARAGVAFANQPQYWKDFSTLMNSDFLVDRRNGLRINIAESEVADAASTAKNKTKAVLNYILSKGYLPTQYADSFAIAAGGATFYRNRIKDLVKREGKTEAEAEAIALKEWREISEENQQSARPDKISQQQASDAGRLILMFANTPMQYARLQKRAIQDLANGRGDAKTNVSKIVYYGFIQNIIFNALQNALFKMGFDDDDSVDEKAIYRTANGMADGLLRGLGIGGQAVSVGKNFLMDIYERSGRSRPEYVDAAWKLTEFSPPISSKIKRLKGAAYPFDNKKMREEIYSKGFSLDNPALMSGAKVISATTNLPLDRVLQKTYNINDALAEDVEAWERVALLGGWPKWTLQPPKETKIPMRNKKEKDEFDFDVEFEDVEFDDIEF
jgi:predicted kinase